MTSLMGKTLSQLTKFADNHLNALAEKAKGTLKARADKLKEKPKQRKNVETREERQARFQAELQLMREKKMRPVLKAEFARHSKNVKKSQDALNPYIETIEQIFSVFNSPNSPFSVRRNDIADTQKVLEFLEPREDLILRGTGDLTGAELRALSEEYQSSTGQKLPHFLKCFRGDNVVSSINSAIPRPAIEFEVSHKALKAGSKEKLVFTIRFEGWHYKAPPTISFKPQNSGYKRYQSRLTEKSFNKAMEQLCCIVLEKTPSFQQEFVGALNELNDRAKAKDFGQRRTHGSFSFRFWK